MTLDNSAMTPSFRTLAYSAIKSVEDSPVLN